MYQVSNFLRTGYFLLSSSLFKTTGGRKRYPRVVQLPITYRCNSKCVMCNIWQMDYTHEMTVDECGRFLKDDIFSKVEAVGINGGEPSLIKELPAFTEEILKLPKIRSLNIISHGFNKKLLLASLEQMYKLCRAKGVSFHVSISLDSYGKTHDTVRGLQVFKLTSDTILEIKNNRSKYCDTFDVGCTVMLQNVDQLKELDAYARLHGLNIKYRLAIENKRIESDKLADQYSLLKHQVVQSAREFFHSRYLLTTSLKRKFKYYAIYYFLTSEKRKRLMGCHWQDNGITMDSRGDLYYCAVKSDRIGGLREATGKAIFFSDKNIEYRKSIVANDCDNCIHDYDGKPYIGNVWLFLKNILFEKYYWVNYYLRSL
ncbi:MAG TPA: radical SAM protein [Chitinophagales bacterium]|nr:radical SAM protein [Chitinophagales bacterium]